MMKAPLVDPDVDLRDFPFMPMDITRLFGSEFNAVSDDATWRAGVTLWLKSYHQVPCGSISGNDVAIAHLCGINLERWKKIKKGALRGWVKCSDGRYYHPVVAEKALEGWIEKLVQRKVSAAGNAKRYEYLFDPAPYDDPINRAKEQLAALNPRSRTLAKRHVKYQTLPSGSHPAPIGSGPGASREPDGTPGDLPGGSQEKGQGRDREEKGRDNIIPISSARDARGERDFAFGLFWDAYPKKTEVDDAKREFDKVISKGASVDDVVAGAKRYAQKVVGKEDDHIASPYRWLHGGRWKDHQHKSKPPDAVSVEGKTLVAREDGRWATLVDRYCRETGKKAVRDAKAWYFPTEWIQELRECVP